MTAVELSPDELLEQNIARSLAEVPHPSLPKGSNLCGGTKLFPDYKAKDGECYFTLVHGIAHESSVSFVALLQATRALRKGFESAIYFYRPRDDHRGRRSGHRVGPGLICEPACSRVRRTGPFASG